MTNSTKWSVVISLGVGTAVFCAAGSLAHAQRITGGLIALYGFDEGAGTTVADTSGFGDPLNLTINPADLSSGLISWGSSFVSINRGTDAVPGNGTISPIQSEGPATKIYDAIVNPDLAGTNEFTIEAWVRPERDGTPGRVLNSNPARVVSMSMDHSFRNFTLGQQDPGDHWVSRIRNSAAGRNGTCCGVPQMPTPAGSVEAEAVTHVVMTRTATGTESLYYNIVGDAFGNVVSREVPSTLIGGGGGTTAGGDPGATDWNPDYALALGDETNVAERKWAGDFHLVAIYNRALTAAEVELNFSAGPDASGELVPGDVNGDMVVDIADYQIIRNNFRLSPAGLPDGNLDFDHEVGLNDFRIWRDAFNAAPSPVPEPTSALLLALGGALVLQRRNKHGA